MMAKRRANGEGTQTEGGPLITINYIFIRYEAVLRYWYSIQRNQTRNEVAQLALNTLKTPVVVPEDNTIKINGGTGDATFNFVGGSVNYVVTASNEPYAQAIDRTLRADNDTLNGVEGWVIQLGEKLYDGKLQLNDEVGVYDVFGRPARKWQYDGKTFGTYPKVENLRQAYTAKVTGKMLYDELGADIVNSVRNNKQWAMKVSIDGIDCAEEANVLNSTWSDTAFTVKSILRTNTDAVGKTGNGTLTQVYVDSINHQVDIAVINTYLAIAEQDYNTRDNDVDLKVYRISDDGHSKKYVKTIMKDKDGNLTNDEIITVKGEDIAITEVKEDDKYLVTVADGEIQTMAKPEIVSETTLNAFKKTSWVKNDDVQYDYAATAKYDVEVLDEYDQTNMKDVTYNVVLDKYGYLVGLELNEQINQYLFLTGIDLGASNLSAKNATANVIFLDGTMSTVTVNVDKSEYAVKPDSKNFTVTGGGEDLADIVDYVPGNSMSRINTWCTYTVDGNNVYTLKQVGSNSLARDTSSNDRLLKTAKKVAQSAFDVAELVKPDVKVEDAPVNKEYVISGKNNSLLGAKHSKTAGYQANSDAGYYSSTPANVVGDYEYVYGNADTVYINAKLKAVDPKVGPKSAIVDKVDSVVTGVTNMDMTVKDLQTNVPTDLVGKGATMPNEEVYVLYGNKGYAIGVVTLEGNDNGASSKYVYVTGEINEEDYLGESSWKWAREAIVDGKKVLIHETNDTMKYIDEMQVGYWYSVTYDKDGNINGIKNEKTGGTKFIKFSEVEDDKFVVKVEDIRLAANGLDGSANGGTRPNFTNKASDTVLLYADITCNGANDKDSNHTNEQGKHTGENGSYNYRYTGTTELKLEGATLWVKNATSEAMQIGPNTKVVVILSKGHNTGFYEEIIDNFEDGPDGVKEALKTLKNETANGYVQFDGIMTGIFDKTTAKVLIFHDQSGKGLEKVDESIKPMYVDVTPVDENGKIIDTDGDKDTTDEVRRVNWNKGTAFAAPDIEGYTAIRGTAPSEWKEGGSAAITWVYAADATNEKVNVVLQFKAGSKIVGSKTLKVELEDGLAVIDTATEGLAEKLAEVNGADKYFHIVSIEPGTEIVSKTGDKVTVNVAWDEITLNKVAAATGELKVTWDTDADKGIEAPAAAKEVTVAGIKVPKGVDLTTSGTGAGKYNSTGTKIDKVNYTRNTELDTDAYGYYKVTLKADVTSNVTNWTGVAALVDGEGTAATALYVPMDSSTASVPAKVTLTPGTGAGTQAAADITLSVASGTGVSVDGTAKLVSQNAPITEGTALTPADVTLKTNISADTEITLQID